MTKNAFSISLEKTATVIQHLVDERNKPGFDLLCKVFEVYPNVSKDWLMQGSGPMFNGHTQVAENSLTAGSAPKVSIQVEAVPAASITEAADSSAVPPADSVKTRQQPSVATPPASNMSEPPIVENATIAASAATPTVPAAVPAADTSWQTALYTQQMAHQLAMAELRNQHLQEQQRLMQQMMDLMQRQLVK